MKNRASWKQILKNVRAVQRDPSLRSQLRSRKAEHPLDSPLLLQSYLDALLKAPNASAGTKRKWRKAAGLE